VQILIFDLLSVFLNFKWFITKATDACFVCSVCICRVDSVLECEQMFSCLMNTLPQMFDKLRLLAPVASFETVTWSGTKYTKPWNLPAVKYKGFTVWTTYQEIMHKGDTNY